MSTSTLTPHATFRSTLAQAAEQARLLLPQAVNGRIESAVKLVLGHDVVFNSDGSATVGSSSDPLKTYTLAGGACDCQDFAYGKAPNGFCQHRIAANLLKSVERVLARSTPVLSEPAEEVVLPEPMEPFADNDPGPVEEPPPPAPAPVPLPEAPASVNVRVQIAGREVQWTLRDTDEARLAGRLEALLARYPVSTPPPASAEPEPEKRYCPTHGTAMRWNAGKDGRKGWWSHKTAEGTWCQGKGGPR